MGGHMNQKENARQASACWLRYGKLTQDTVIAAYNRWSRRIVMTEKLPRILTAAEELSEGIQGMLGWMPEPDGVDGSGWWRMYCVVHPE